MTKEKEIRKVLFNLFNDKDFPEDTNKVIFKARIEENAEFSHEMYGEKFYLTKVSFKRKSGNEDIIPLMVSNYLLEPKTLIKGKWIKGIGQLRSKHVNHNLKVFIFALDIFGVFDKLDEEDESDLSKNYSNMIYLNGYICKEPYFIITNKNKCAITELFISIKRPNKKVDYIPCFAWGENAYKASVLDIGTHIKCLGRIQNRTYIKNSDDGSNESQIREVYEVSISQLKIL